MSNLTTDAATWLEEQFEYEFCAECGGDSQHHTAVPIFGNWFARCDYPLPDEESSEDFHPTIAVYRQQYNTRG